MSSDENLEYVDPARVKPNQTGLRYGLVGALISIIISLASNMMGLTAKPGMGMVIMFVQIIVFVAIIAMAVRYHRDRELGGYISLGRAVTVGMIVVLIIAVAAAIFGYLYTTVIDPGFYENLMVQMEEQWEAQGLSDEQIEGARNMMSRFQNPGLSAAIGIFVNLIIGLIVSLIVGAILKKSPPASMT